MKQQFINISLHWSHNSSSKSCSSVLAKADCGYKLTTRVWAV